jgi:PIN domain nuclease of toxin-antitoxin system
MSDSCLLDTHVLLWAVAEPQRLAPEIQSLIREQHYTVSVASLWELINKKGKQGAPVKDPAIWWTRYVVNAGTQVLPIRNAHVLYLDRLPAYHRDPYDRILIAQSVVEEIAFVTADKEIRKYGIRIREASGGLHTEYPAQAMADA